MSHPKIKLIIGLGNPGADYKNTYHNAGFLALDWIKKYQDMGPWKKADKLFEYTKSGEMILAKTLVFMNESGEAAAKAQKYFAVPPENILLIHDDSDIEIGKLKLDFNKSSAGHKGVQSVIDAFGTAQFWRIRIGVRGPKNKGKALDFVLKKINPVHKKKLEETFKKIPALLDSGL